MGSTSRLVGCTRPVSLRDAPRVKHQQAGPATVLALRHGEFRVRVDDLLPDVRRARFAALVLVRQIAAGERHHVHLGADGQMEPHTPGMARLAKFTLNRLGRRQKVVRGERHRIEVRGTRRALGHQIEHLDTLRIEPGHFNLPRRVAPVAAAARRHIDALAAFRQQLAHALHRLSVVHRLARLLFRRIVDVALGEDAEQVAAHAERHGQRIGDHALTRHEDHAFPDGGIAVFEEQADRLRIAFSLMVCQHHDVLVRRQLRLDARQVVQPGHRRRHLIDQRPQKLHAKGVVIEGRRDLLDLHRSDFLCLASLLLISLICYLALFLNLYF